MKGTVIRSAVCSSDLDQPGHSADGRERDKSDALDGRWVAGTQTPYHELWQLGFWPWAPEHEPRRTTVQDIDADRHCVLLGHGRGFSRIVEPSADLDAGALGGEGSRPSRYLKRQKERVSRFTRPRFL